MQETALKKSNAMAATPLLSPGDIVYLKKFTRKHKFDDRFSGPHEVLNVTDEQNVEIATPGITTQGTYMTHRDRLKTRPSRERRPPERLGNPLVGVAYDEALAQV